MKSEAKMYELYIVLKKRRKLLRNVLVGRRAITDRRGKV